MTKQQVIDRAKAMIARYAGISKQATKDLISDEVLKGKLYEAHVLGWVMRHLVRDEQFTIQLNQGTTLQLKSSPGPINRGYPHFRLSRGGAVVAEMWTDVEFYSLSYALSKRSAPTPGDYHELDILVADLGVAIRPMPDEVWLGVECKHTTYEKSLLREALGVRRELSLLTGRAPTRFQKWPRSEIPANPPSCLVVYTTDRNVVNYAKPGEVFGIDFIPLRP